jgi:hypothetical protein
MALHIPLFFYLSTKKVKTLLNNFRYKKLKTHFTFTSLQNTFSTKTQKEIHAKKVYETHI